MDKVQLREHSRTYMFPDGDSITFYGVVEFAKPGSTHRLKLATGEHVIVGDKWQAIVIKGIDDWTV